MPQFWQTFAHLRNVFFIVSKHRSIYLNSCLNSCCLGIGYWHAQSTGWRSVTSRKPKELCEESLKTPGEKCWCSSLHTAEGTNTGLLLMGAFVLGTYACVIVYVSYFISLTLGSQGGLNFGKCFKKLFWNCFFLRVRSNSNQTTTTHNNLTSATYSATTFNLNWEKGSTALLWHDLQGANLS